MKRKRLLAAVMATVMASTLTMSMPMTGYAMDQGTETVASEPEGSNSSDAAVTNPEQDAESVAESTDEKSTAEESDAVSESQEMKPDAASVEESTEAEDGVVAVPETQNNAVGATEDNGAASAGTVGAAETKTSGNFEYKVKNNGTIDIAKYTGHETNVTIPKTIDGKKVTDIGYDAFKDCISLQQITIPDGVTSIGWRAFAGCTSLQQITIPDSVTSIGSDGGSDAFYGCTSLQQITIPDGVTSIGSDAFYGCTSLQQITIPDGVTSIGSGAFYGCKALQQITIPDGVTYIGGGAFDGCSSLQEITIPDGVTSIEYGTFRNCSSLQQTTIPDGVNEIGDETFKGCTSLQQITIPDSVTSIGDSAFRDCEALTQITIPDGVTSIEGGIFSGCDSLQEITIPNSVTSIKMYAFDGCSSLQEIAIPDGVTSIGDAAFDSCSSLTQITIPDSVTSIEYGTFRNCSSLQQITVPDGVNEIGGEAFEGCTSLQQITIPDGVTSIGVNAFEGCTSLQQITIPDSVTSIGYYAFCNCSSLQRVTIPDGVTSIGYGTFYNCSSLQQITIPSGVTNIENGIFSGCSSLQQITIPNSVTDIGSGAFSSCSSLQQITIPNSVTSIKSYAFSGCSSLQQITIPSGVTSIEPGTFSDCKALQQITIPDSVTSIGDSAFRDCEALTQITIPDSVTKIGESAFNGRTSLTAIYFYGNAPKHSGGNDPWASFPSDVTLYVLKGKSGWTVPTWDKWHTAYFTPENKPASTPTPVPTATPTPVPTQEAFDIDTTKYDPDYTQLFQDFMINKDTWDAVKMLVKNENFPHFKYIYTHDQKTSTYIKAYFADAFYRDDHEGLRDMSSGEVSQEYARNVLLALMDQQEVETEAIVRAREVQKWGKFSSDLIKNTIDTSKIILSDQVLKQLKQFCDSKTIKDALLNGKYGDLSKMYLEAGYKDDPEALKLLKEAQDSPLNQKWLKGILKVTDVGVDVGLDLADDYTVCQRIFDYDVSSETDQVYIELLTYIKDNAKFEVVRDAAADLLTTLTDERKSQQQKIASVFAQGTGKKVVGMAVQEVLEKFGEKTYTGKKIITIYKLTKWTSDQVLQVKNYQEQYDNMRVLSYIGDAIGQWTLENYTAYIHNVHSSDAAQKNTYAKKSYFGLHWLISTREDGEKAYQGLKKRLLKAFSQDKEGYQSSLIMSTTMETYRKTLFTDEREKAFYAEAVACPVDVEVYNSAGKKVLTIKNGQEIPVTTSGDIVYMEYQNPGNGEYGKIVIFPQNAGYTLKYVGTGLGSMSLQTMNMSAETVSEKYLQNIPVAKGTVAEISDPFENSSITLTTGKDSQKTTMKMKTPELTYVPVTSLTFSSASIKLKEGESSLVTVKVEPENAANQNITWTSASDSIATVSADGVVTGKSAGTTTLTASAEDGKVTKKLTVTVTKKEDSGKSQESRSMYRLYNPNSGEHFYTSNQGERDHLVSLGWRYEGVAWNAPLTGAPIFRLYNPNAGDHHYTGSEKERDDLVKLGWKYEGVAWYTAPSTTKKPQYRLYNPNCTGAGAHHYTGSIEERDGLVKLGWRYEGIAWYGV